MRILILITIFLLAAVMAAAVYFRFASMPAEIWHVDPATANLPNTPNAELRQGQGAPVVALPPASVAEGLAQVAEVEGATQIAGDLTEGFATYVQRTRLMGYPDAISIRLTPVDEGTRVEIFSRSRFGRSDFGVNAARVDRWLAAIAP